MCVLGGKSGGVASSVAIRRLPVIPLDVVYFCCAGTNSSGLVGAEQEKNLLLFDNVNPSLARGARLPNTRCRPPWLTGTKPLVVRMAGGFPGWLAPRHGRVWCKSQFEYLIWYAQLFSRCESMDFLQTVRTVHMCVQV